MAVEIRGVIASQTASNPDPLFDLLVADFLALSRDQRNSLFFECPSILPQELLSYVRRAVGFPSPKLPTSKDFASEMDGSFEITLR